MSLAFSAVACAPPVVTPTPGPQAPAPVPAADPLDSPWNVRATPGTFTQRMDVQSELVSRIDSVQRVDSSRAVITVEWSRLAGAAPARLSGLLTEFALTADTLPPVTPPQLRLPVAFSAIEGTGAAQATLQRPAPEACGLDASAVAAVRELLVAPPSRVERGTTWSDSTSFMACRDSIPFAVTSHREFRVTGAERHDGVLVVHVDRRTRLTMKGEGLQFGETISISAEGEGEASLVIRADGAVVVGGSVTTTLRMQMRGRRRSQELTQHTRIEITGR